VIWQDYAVRDNDGRKLDHKTLEALRIRAVDRVGEGAHPEDVAAALGLHCKTVYDWPAKYREGGKDALKARAVPGRPPKLGGPQLSRLTDDAVRHVRSGDGQVAYRVVGSGPSEAWVPGSIAGAPPRS
jgi:hypothetical protein